MRITGPIPENYLRLMSPEDREPLGKAGMTLPEIEEKNDVASEKKLQDLIENYLTLRDIFVGRQRMDKKSNMALGWPDFVFAYKGKPIALEVKVGSNKQTPEQLHAERLMIQNGWAYYVVRSLPEVKAILDAI
jgi:hypothetical protein